MIGNKGNSTLGNRAKEGSIESYINTNVGKFHSQIYFWFKFLLVGVFIKLIKQNDRSTYVLLCFILHIITKKFWEYVHWLRKDWFELPNDGFQDEFISRGEEPDPQFADEEENVVPKCDCRGKENEVQRPESDFESCDDVN